MSNRRPTGSTTSSRRRGLALVLAAVAVAAGCSVATTDRGPQAAPDQRPTVTAAEPADPEPAVPADEGPRPPARPELDDDDLHGLVPLIEPVALEPAERGQTGEEVVRLQQRLVDLGIGGGSADGVYGAKTATAVAAFQALVGLEPTGDADGGTVAALGRYVYDGVVVRAGDEGALVERLQRQLADGPFDPGPADGRYGLKTRQAVWALEKLANLPVDGDWGPLDAAAWDRLMVGEIGQPTEQHEVRWVEFDLSQQVVRVYDPGSDTPALVVHASSGSGIPWENEDHRGSSITPTGDFAIGRRISGWRESSLGIGSLYNPLYFNGGIAFHGALSVPLYPASHGCVRVPMHVAEYLPAELPNGTPVHVYAS